MKGKLDRWDCTGGEEILSVAPFFSVERQRWVQAASQKEGDFYVCHLANWVQVVALTENRELILVSQFRFGSRSLSLETPGGCLNEGEPPVAGGLRELEEETGYRTDPENCKILATVRPNPALQDNYLTVLLAQNCQPTGKKNFDPYEDLLTELITWERMLEKIRAGEINHALTITALLLANEFQPLPGRNS